MWDEEEYQKSLAKSHARLLLKDEIEALKLRAERAEKDLESWKAYSRELRAVVDRQCGEIGITEPNAMSEEEMRVAIAEAVGWRKDVDPRAPGFWSPPDSTDEFVAELPDYLNDLNAMHAAEETLTPERCFLYARKIERVCGTDNDFRLGPKAWHWHATARQKAEAFLMAISPKKGPTQ